MMNVKELAELNRKNGGHFFDADKLKSEGDTLNSFELWSPEDPELAEYKVFCRRKSGVGPTWTFNLATGRIIPNHSTRY